MSEVAPEAPEAPEAETPEATPETPAQEPTDWKAMARKHEERAKANKAALDELTAKFEATEAEKATLAERVQEFETKAERAKTVAEVAEAAGVPANALRGNTREELEEHAKTLAELIKPSAPVIPGQERTPGKVPPSEDREFVGKLFGNNN